MSSNCSTINSTLPSSVTSVTHLISLKNQKYLCILSYFLITSRGNIIILSLNCLLHLQIIHQHINALLFKNNFIPFPWCPECFLRKTMTAFILTHNRKVCDSLMTSDLMYVFTHAYMDKHMHTQTSVKASFMHQSVT